MTRRLSLAVLAAAATLTHAAHAAEGPNDAQIAAIVVTANQVDVDAGKLAAGKTKSAAVKAFAQQMVTDHSGVNKLAVDLVTKLKVKPQDNPTAQSLQKGGDDNLARLRTWTVRLSTRPMWIAKSTTTWPCSTPWTRCSSPVPATPS